MRRCGSCLAGSRASIALAIALALSALGNAQTKPSIILATTTSTQDSGLLDALVPRFEKERGIEVEVIAVGTGAALRMAGSGDADVVLVHAPEAERKYVESGDLVDGRLVMHNDFVIVRTARRSGPREDSQDRGRRHAGDRGTRRVRVPRRQLRHAHARACALDRSAPRPESTSRGVRKPVRAWVPL